ncbi:MAG: hypothetical protein EBX52_13765, partial [Proteobacteria bacterium]|nr:hypothetical protein [Pseudomonadota bacterium]
KTAPAPSAEEPTENHAEGNTPLFTPDEIAQLNQRRRPYETMEDPSTAPELRTVRAPRSSAFRSSYPSSFSSSETNSLTLGNPLPKSDSVPGTHRVLSYRNEIPPERIAEERLAYAYETQAVKETQPHPAIQEKQPRIALGEKSFFVNHFTPGLSESGKALPVRKSIDLALDGPDYLLEESNDPAALKKLQSRVLGFGRGGELILEIADQGEIEDESGPDFVIYGKLHERFAKVAVSDRLEEDSFHWFECEPEKSIVIGCAGVVPTAQGGDTFDLRAIGVKSARYIKIKDWGKNRSTGTDPAWFELDSLKLIHASKPQL